MPLKKLQSPKNCHTSCTFAGGRAFFTAFNLSVPGLMPSSVIRLGKNEGNSLLCCQTHTFANLFWCCVAPNGLKLVGVLQCALHVLQSALEGCQCTQLHWRCHWRQSPWGIGSLLDTQVSPLGWWPIEIGPFWAPWKRCRVWLLDAGSFARTLLLGRWCWKVCCRIHRFHQYTH